MENLEKEFFYIPKSRNYYMNLKCIKRNLGIIKSNVSIKRISLKFETVKIYHILI